MGVGYAVDEDQIPAVKIMNERSGRIDREGSSCDDEHIGIDNSIQAFINGFAIKLFFIENNIRLDKTAAGTAGNAGRGEDLPPLNSTYGTFGSNCGERCRAVPALFCCRPSGADHQYSA